MNRNSLVLVIVATVFSANEAYSADDSYRCDINTTAHGVSDKSAKWKSDLAKNNSVIIDRETGKVFHPLLSNSSFQNTKIIHKGSDVNSFKVISISPDGGFVQFYQVDEFAEGHRKPFFAAVESSAYFGICE